MNQTASNSKEPFDAKSKNWCLNEIVKCAQIRNDTWIAVAAPDHKPQSAHTLHFSLSSGLSQDKPNFHTTRSLVSYPIRSPWHCVTATTSPAAGWWCFCSLGISLSTQFKYRAGSGIGGSIKRWYCDNYKGEVRNVFDWDYVLASAALDYH